MLSLVWFLELASEPKISKIVNSWFMRKGEHLLGIQLGMQNFICNYWNYSIRNKGNATCHLKTNNIASK